MKTSIALIAAVSATALLAACNSGEDATPATDMAAAPADAMPADAMAEGVAAYVPAAAMGDMYEIQAAGIALEKSENAEVRRLAEMIRTDHTAASESFMRIVPEAAPNVAPPTALDARHQGMIDALNAAPEAGFDMAYIDQQIAAHNEAVAVHRGFSDNAEYPTLAEHSRTVLPKIESHLRMAEEIKAGM